MRHLSISLIAGTLALAACDGNRADKTAKVNTTDQSYQQTSSPGDAQTMQDNEGPNANSITSSQGRAATPEMNNTAAAAGAGAAAGSTMSKSESNKASSRAGASAPSNVDKADRGIKKEKTFSRSTYNEQINERTPASTKVQNKQSEEFNRWREYEKKTYNELQLSDDKNDYPITDGEYGWDLDS